MTQAETLESIQRRLSTLGAVLYGWRPVSAHPRDHYLTVVLAHRPECADYVTWLFNADTGELVSGHYDQTLTEALADFTGRR